MKLQGQTPQVDKLLLIRGRCCRTGTVSSVFPILHLGFLLLNIYPASLFRSWLPFKYTPMKTEAPQEKGNLENEAWEHLD